MPAAGLYIGLVPLRVSLFNNLICCPVIAHQALGEIKRELAGLQRAEAEAVAMGRRASPMPPTMPGVAAAHGGNSPMHSAPNLPSEPASAERRRLMNERAALLATNVYVASPFRPCLHPTHNWSSLPLVDQLDRGGDCAGTNHLTR